MTETGNLRRLRSKGAIAAIGLGTTALAIATIAVPSETLASFADNVWAGTEFSTGKFGIQTSLTGLSDSFSDGPKDLRTADFAPPISLTPNATAFAPVYLRTAPGTTEDAKVRISTPSGQATSNSALWSTYVTYAARAVDVTTTAAACGNSVFSPMPGSTWLFGTGTGNASNVTLPTAADAAQTFTLSSNANTTYMVCFRFTLSPGVTATPAANGASVYPMWTFTGTQAP